MKRRPLIAGILSLLVPGLGQVYRGESHKGAAIMAVAIVIGSLNIIILPLISMANPVTPPPGTWEARAIWAYWIPRIGHEVLSLWSVAFWLWAIFDAVSIARKR
jgi:TM2 domain-containing membrane protein YozV